MSEEKKKLHRLVARATAETECRTAVKVRKFTFYTDEPVAEGGTDQAANPVETLLGALAGCINVVAHIAAKKVGITLRSLKLTVTGELDGDGMFGDPEVSPWLQHIDVNMEADMDADADQKRRWLEMIEPNCPIAETLRKGTDLRLNLVKEQRDICC